MATAAVDEEEDVLTCSVCLDSYTDPCTLQCKHSFCRRCITDYVKTQADAVQNKTIPCPSCRQVTKVPDPSRPVDEWAGQLQPGHVVQELMAKVKQDTTVEDSRCFPCQQLGENIPAKFWCVDCEAGYCQGCVKPHSVIPTSRGHVLCDIQDKSKIRQQRKFRCKEHNEELKLYCKDCNKIHCQLCFVDNHRKCEDVVTIKSFISDMKTELSEVGQKYAHQEKESQSIITMKKERISQLNIDKTSAVDGIRRASQKLVDHIKKKEKELTDEVEETVKIETKGLRSDIKVWNIQMQTYRQYCEYIKQAVSSDSEVEVCDIYQVWTSGQLDISQEGDKKMGRTVLFSEDVQNIKAIESLHLGDIATAYLPTETTANPVQSDSIDTRVDNDKYTPDIRDVAVLEIEGALTIVVTDFNNNSLKSFKSKGSRKCHSHLPLENPPWGITQLGENKVIVAVPDSLQIVTVEVTPDLTCVNHTNTSKSYFSLALMTGSRLAAGASNCVDILSMQGEVMTSLTANSISEPDFLCVRNTGDIVVSDWHTGRVTCFSAHGLVIWQYFDREPCEKCFPFKCPYDNRGTQITKGIAKVNGSDILLVDRYFKKVFQLSKSGEYVRDVLTSQDGLRDPESICVDKHGRLFVCDDGRILMFSFI